MNVKISFDKAAVERRGLTLENARRTVKSLFAVHDLPCVSDGEVLICAASCVWQDENGEEDVLAQAGKVPET